MAKVQRKHILGQTENDRQSWSEVAARATNPFRIGWKGQTDLENSERNFLHQVWEGMQGRNGETRRENTQSTFGKIRHLRGQGVAVKCLWICGPPSPVSKILCQCKVRLGSRLHSMFVSFLAIISYSIGLGLIPFIQKSGHGSFSGCFSTSKPFSQKPSTTRKSLFLFTLHRLFLVYLCDLTCNLHAVNSM